MSFETARAMRYGFLTETAQEVGVENIATAHNADDNAETVIFNLCRGAGLAGLCGIPPVRGRIVRPLLDMTRAEIERSRQAPRPEVVARPPAVTASSPASAPVDNSCLAQWRRYVDASACFDPCRTRNGLRADCAAGCQEVSQPYCRLPDAIKRELQNRP